MACHGGSPELRVLTVVLGILVVTGSGSGSRAGLSTTTAQFLKIPGGIRSASLGEAYVALADDAAAINWNPAGLAQIQRGEFQSMFLKYFADINYFFGGLVLPAGELGTIGTSLVYEWVPPFNSTADPNAIKGVASDLGLSLAFGRWVHSRVAVGMSANFYSSRLIDREAKGGGLDVGVLVPIVLDKLHLGLSYENVVSGMSRFRGLEIQDKLPTTLRAGLMARMNVGADVSGLLSLEYSKPSDSVNWFKAGVELTYKNTVAIRAGYKLRAEGNPFQGKGHLDLGGLTGSSFGAGVNLERVGFHYAYIPLGDLGATHRLGLTYYLGPSTPGFEEQGGFLEEVPEISVDTDIDTATGVLNRADIRLDALSRGRVQEDIDTWVLDIKDPEGNVVRSFRGRGQPPPTVSWDGKDEVGGTVLGGAYSSFRLRMTSREGKKIIEESSFSAPEELTRSGDRTRRGEKLPKEKPRPSLRAKEFVPDRRGVIRIPAILFPADSARFSRDYHEVLRVVAGVIAKNPGCRVYLEGHAGQEGSPQATLRLSQDRANAVLRHLVEKMGIQPAAITARGHGSTAPRTRGETEEERATNRRVEILVVRPKKSKP